MYRSKLIFCLSLFSISVFGQIPAGYYNPAAGLTGAPLQNALHNIIKNHTIVPYGNLYAAFDSTDIKPDSTLWDIYSDVPGGPQPYVYYNNTTWQCGNYNSEADCFNREHSWPQSWFNGLSPAYSDLFHIYPTDGWVNGKRSNYPYGKVSNPSYVSMNGSKLGPNTTVGYTLTVFEPIDEYKGDLARGYFYMATRYLGEDAGWSSSDATNKAVIEPWELCVLLSWHNQDPVSVKEINRNNAIYKMQNNRNPYIDHPGWADTVFTCALVRINSFSKDLFKVSVFPNPATEVVNIEVSGKAIISLYNTSGQLIFNRKAENDLQIDLNGINKGLYLLRIELNGRFVNRKLLVE